MKYQMPNANVIVQPIGIHKGITKAFAKASAAHPMSFAHLRALGSSEETEYALCASTHVYSVSSDG